MNHAERTGAYQPGGKEEPAVDVAAEAIPQHIGRYRIVAANCLRQADAFVERSQRQPAGGGRERSFGHLDLDGQRCKEIQLENRSGQK